MTPAVVVATNAGIDFRLHEYRATGDGVGRHWGLEAADVLGIDSKRVFKTIVTQIDSQSLCVAVVPIACEVNLKALANAAGGKKAALAPTDQAQRSSGYVTGGISPLGQRQLLPTFVDISALQFETIFVSGGRRGLEIELSGHDLLHLTKGQAVEIRRPLPTQ